MTFVHVTPRTGRQITILLDKQDVRLYQSRKWRVTDKGLAEATKRQYRFLHRLILKAPPTHRCWFRDGNRFNLQRDNLRMKHCGRVYGKRPGLRLIHKSDESMIGVVFKKGEKGDFEARASIGINGKSYTRIFATNIQQGFDGVKVTKTEAYRRAVCWRLGMMLQNGDLPDKRSLDIFFEEHRRLSPYPSPFAIHAYKAQQMVTARISQLARKIDRKMLKKNFRSILGMEDCIRKAVFWVVGTLFVDNLAPDEGTVELLKKTIAYYYTPPAPEEMYDGNAEYVDAKSLGRSREDKFSHYTDPRPR